MDAAERQNERSSIRRTLHADVNQTAKGGEANAQPSIDSIRQSNDNSQEKSSDNKIPTADPDIRYQQRELRLSDRAVLCWAAEKAMRERSKRWSIEDLNRFDILVKKLKGLDEAYAELEALKRYKKTGGRRI